ncbi:hypothetical protein N9D66_02210, partial [Candidatus Nanopelagicales bacterium]|nr:hypothetical protein [Candidatus Nanopelagicales bacterium]
GLAKMFANSFMSGLLKSAGSETFNQVLRALGYDPGDTAEVAQALAEIQQSLSHLEDQNQQIIEAIDQLQNETLRGQFLVADGRVEAAAGQIAGQLELLQIWVADGVTPDQTTLTAAVNSLNAQINALERAAGAPQSGAVPLLMRAYERNVSDSERHWQLVSDYRDQVRVSLAQAVGAIELIIEHWYSPSGEYHGNHSQARNATFRTVDNMYGFGVQPFGPNGQAFVQLKGDAALTADFTKNKDQDNIPDADRWLWESRVVQQSAEECPAHPAGYQCVALEPWLEEMAEKYRPGNHDGMTLEEFLQSHNIATTFVYTDAFDYVQTTENRRVECEQVAGTRVCRDVRDVVFHSQATLGQIVGNSYEKKKVSFGHPVQAGDQTRSRSPYAPKTWKWNNDYRYRAEPEIHMHNAYWAHAARGIEMGPYYGDPWQDFTDRHEAKSWVTISTDGHNELGGWLTDSRPESIEKAAYGTAE